MSNTKFKYSLWTLEALNCYTVMAYKRKDTNSASVVDKWIDKDSNNAGSFYRQEDEINAMYLQTFDNN
jgi:hypothetical protein